MNNNAITGNSLPHGGQPSSSIPMPVLSLFYTNPTAAIALTITVTILIVITLVGNLMVCFAISLVRRLKSQPANLLLVSLALADFLVGLLVMPIALVNLLDDRWILGDLICRLWTTADLTLCTASILNLCLISIDRYSAVTKALRYIAQRTRRRILLYIAVAWIGAFFVSAAPLILLPFDSVENTNTCQVTQNKFYQIYATMISFYGPCLTMIVLYIKMWRAAQRLREATSLEWLGGDTLRSQSTELKTPKESDEKGERNGKKVVSFKRPDNERSMSSSGQINSKLIVKGEDKARKTLSVICGVFIVCWLPFFVLALVKSQYSTLRVPKWVHEIVLWLGYSNRHHGRPPQSENDCNGATIA